MKLAAGAMLALVPLLAVAGTSFKPSILVVEVHEGEDRRIVAPVPLALVRAGLIVAPDEIRNLQVTEAGPLDDESVERFLPELERMARALRDAPDGTYLEALDGEDRMEIGKEQGILQVRMARGSSEQVDLGLPLDVLLEGTESFDAEAGTIRTSALVSALSAAPSGQLLHVAGDDAQVGLRMW